MTTFEPMTPNWLTPTFDQMMADDPELIPAYGWLDYSSKLAGEGNWIDLFLTEDSDDFPVGRLWINPETSDVGLMPVKGGNGTYLTKAALNLREFNFHGASALQAYNYVKNDFYCGEEQTGDLTSADTGIVSRS